MRPSPFDSSSLKDVQKRLVVEVRRIGGDYRIGRLDRPLENFYFAVNCTVLTPHNGRSYVIVEKIVRVWPTPVRLKFRSSYKIFTFSWPPEIIVLYEIVFVRSERASISFFIRLGRRTGDGIISSLHAFDDVCRVV